MEERSLPIPTQLRRHLLAFLLHSSHQLQRLPIVKYTALSFFSDRFLPSLRSFVQGNAKGNWLLQPIRESNLQLFALISIWISSKIHDTCPLSAKSLKSLGDEVIGDQHFTTRDFVEAELIFMKVLRFDMGASNTAFIFLEELFIQLQWSQHEFGSTVPLLDLASAPDLAPASPTLRRSTRPSRPRHWEVAKIGDIMNMDVCMNIMDLLYETEEMTLITNSPQFVAASILVASYFFTVPKQHSEFPILPWVKFVTSYREEDVAEVVRGILEHVLIESSGVFKSY